MRFLAYLILTLSTAAAWAQEPVRNPPADVAGLQGWSGPESLKHTAEWAAQQPPFTLIHPQTGEPVWQDNTRARVCLWEDQAIANGGALPTNVAQLIGDCTSHGAKHAIERTLGRQLARGPPGQFKTLSPEFIYGTGRVWIAKGAFGPGDGCSGAAIARGCRDIGVIPQDTPGIGPYNGRRAKEWGAKGPPDALREIAAKHRVKTVSLLRTPDDVRDAVCNGFGVTVASSWGTTNDSMRTQDGRIVARRKGRWMHQMCIDGYDGSSPSGKQYWHVTNSWGPDAHPAPIDGSPPGGFWIERPDLEFMLAPGDTWAFSEFDGFPAELDLSPLRPKRRQPAPEDPQPVCRREAIPTRRLRLPLKGSVS
jgi:hypothetical protein